MTLFSFVKTLTELPTLTAPSGKPGRNDCLSMTTSGVYPDDPAYAMTAWCTENKVPDHFLKYGCSPRTDQEV